MNRAMVAAVLAATSLASGSDFAGAHARTVDAAQGRPFDAALGAAQARRYGGQPVLPNPAYDGQFTFVRLRYGPPTPYVSQGVPWSHDYPIGERHFMEIMNEVSLLHPKTVETSILGLDEPDLFRHPIVYMAEPGYWTISDQEAAAFRSYLLKGGFVIFDDFSEQRGGWGRFEAAFRRVLPEAVFFDLDPSHPIFHAFFEIASFDILPQAYDVGRPVLRGVFEQNDPSKRLMAMINYNTDISEYWEESGTGWRPDWETNEAYKLGVNYVIYGLTH
jgi:hypothetical protein